MHTVAHPEEAVSSSIGKTDVAKVSRSAAWFVCFMVLGLVAIGLDNPPGPLPAGAPLTAFSSERAAEHLSIIAHAAHPMNSPEHDVVRDYNRAYAP
jgi:hypothetical protein